MSELLRKHSFTIQITTIVTVVLFVISMTAWVVDERAAIYKELDTAENQYEHCSKWMDSMKIRVENLEQQEIEQDLVIVEVRTQLAQIFTILEEIKTKL